MNIFCKWYFHNASKEVFWQKLFFDFMHGFKNAISAEWKNCQNGTFEPVHEIQIFFYCLRLYGIDVLATDILLWGEIE